MEVWKTIEGFEDYEISSLGNVKSLKYGKEKILNKSINSQGYYCVCLSLNNKKHKKNIHQLLAVSFFNHTPNGYKLVINHIDFIRTNNKIENLEIVTQRKNANQKHLKSSSQYVGVSWAKHVNKWHAQIHVNGEQKNLGYFINEIQAHSAYQKELLTIF
jgi:hypothetical protein